MSKPRLDAIALHYWVDGDEGSRHLSCIVSVRADSIRISWLKADNANLALEQLRELQEQIDHDSKRVRGLLMISEGPQ